MINPASKQKMASLSEHDCRSVIFWLEMKKKDLSEQCVIVKTAEEWMKIKGQCELIDMQTHEMKNLISTK